MRSSEARGVWWHYALAIVWPTAIALLLVGPALGRGAMLGTYDLLSNTSLTAVPGVVVHGNYYNTDPIVQMIPWTGLAWTQVHHGVLPLWNPYNGAGLPFAFNWQSATFSVPSLVGYLFPLRYAYTVGIVVTLVIAGSGGYVLGRVLRLGVIGSLTIASIFELSGPLVAWLGYPQSQTMAWAGWLFAAGLLVLRGGRRWASIALLAVVVACAIYSGHPETLITLLISTVLLVLVMLLSRALPPRFGLPKGPVRRPTTDVMMGLVAGAALGAPLLLPGFQLANLSVRTTGTASNALPLHTLLYFPFTNFDGMPVPGNFAFGDAFFYNETAAYVGIIALVFASMGILIGFLARRPEPLAIAAVGVVLVLIVYAPLVTHLITRLPFMGNVLWARALMPLCLVLAALAGVGIDAMTKPTESRLVRLWPLGAFVTSLLLVGLLWFFGRNRSLPKLFGTTFGSHVRAESFVWPIIAIAVGLVVSAVVFWGPRLGRLGALVLVGVEIAVLLSAGTALQASSVNGAQPTRAIAALQHAVGSARVGAGGKVPGGACSFAITPDANVFFGVHEVNLYDPIMPKAYFSQWQRETHSSAGTPILDQFCPALQTVGQARQLGVSYVVEPAGEHGPKGSRFVERLVVPNPYPPNFLRTAPPSEDLYFIPGSKIATLSTGSNGRGTGSATMTTSGSNPANLNILTHATKPGLLQVRVTNVPGWSATLDGRPLTLDRSSTFELRAHIPAGTHRVEFHYWPSLFTAGLVLALVALIALGGALAWEQQRRRPMHRHHEESSPGDVEFREDEMLRANSHEKQPAHAGSPPI